MRTDAATREIYETARRLAFQDSVRSEVLALLLEEAHAGQVPMQAVIDAILAGHIGPLMQTKIDAWLEARGVPRERLTAAVGEINDARECTQAELIQVIEGFGPYPTTQQATEIRQWGQRFSGFAKRHQQSIEAVKALVVAQLDVREYPWQ